MQRSRPSVLRPILLHHALHLSAARVGAFKRQGQAAVRVQYAWGQVWGSTAGVTWGSSGGWCPRALAACAAAAPRTHMRCGAHTSGAAGMHAHRQQACTLTSSIVPARCYIAALHTPARGREGRCVWCHHAGCFGGRSVDVWGREGTSSAQTVHACCKPATPGRRHPAHPLIPPPPILQLHRVACPPPLGQPPLPSHILTCSSTQ